MAALNPFLGVIFPFEFIVFRYFREPKGILFAMILFLHDFEPKGYPNGCKL